MHQKHHFDDRKLNYYKIIKNVKKNKSQSRALIFSRFIISCAVAALCCYLKNRVFKLYF